MPRPTAHCLYAVIVSAAFGLLTGCGSSEPALPEVRVLTEAEANARTVVPLTRTVALDKPGVIADVEFDLPPPSENAAATLVLGIRIKAAEPRDLLSLSDRLRGRQLPAKVRFDRIEGDRRIPVELVRIGNDLRERIVLPDNGWVPGIFPHSIGGEMPRRVGLVREDVLYRVFAFGFAARATPGRYRLRVELLEQRSELRDVKSELIIAYGGRSK